MRGSWPWWRYGLTGLSGLGLALSGFLSWHYLTGRSMVGCGGGSPCDHVLNSRWSAVGGVLPVSGLAAGAYLAMLVSSFSLGPSTSAPVRRLAWHAMLVLAGAAAGSAVWFTIVQKWHIGAFCPYCMATHITGLLLAALAIWRASRQFDDDPTDDPTDAPRVAGVADPGRPRRGRLHPNLRTSGPTRSALRPLPSALAGFALAGVLAAGQVGFAPSNVYRSGASQENPTALDPHTVPLVGSADARSIVTLLFDYKCPHCQQLHLMLGEVIRRYGDQLAFVLCPAPLNSRCNPYVSRDVDEFKDSCELARVALTVWVAGREAFPAFDRWMYSFESGDRWHPRSLKAAKARAVELVGEAKFDAAWADPWIGRYMQTSIRIYGQTMQNGAGGIPKLVFGPRWVTPEPRDADDLVSILQAGLAVPKP